MLNWFAGQRPLDQGHDRDRDDTPETPAPVFAVKAFKHALFGTPNPAQPKQRRSSVFEREAGRSNAARPIRPGMTRPKSANDASTLVDLGDAPQSPTKGILLTPGTLSGRGKTVTFGDLSKDGLWADTPDATDKRNGRKSQRDGSLRMRSNSLDSVQPMQHSGVADLIENDHECCDEDFQQEPSCAIGQYWKKEYDIYRDKTADEVRKLLTKQRAAKSFAREKDTQCSALTEELRSERSKVARLEAKVTDLQSQLDAMNADMASLRLTTASQPQQPAALLGVPKARVNRVQGIDNTQAVQHRKDLSRLDRSTIATEIQERERLGAKPSLYHKVDAEEPVAKPTVSHGVCLPDMPTGLPIDMRRDSTQANQLVIASDKVSRRRDSVNTSEWTSRAYRQPLTTSSKPTQFASVVQESHQALKSPPVDSLRAHPSDCKENILPDRPTETGPMAEAVPGLTSNDRILNRGGEAIPPDRVAAARARLAARRQMRAEA